MMFISRPNNLPIKHFIFILFTGLILLGLQACSSESVPPLSKLKEDAIILAFGDSLTFGTGAKSETESYPVILAQRINRQVINAGISGETTSGGLERLPQVLKEYQPQLMILCLGGNDMLRRMSTRVTHDNLRKMIQIAKEQHIEVVLLGVPEPSVFLSAADFYSDLAKEFNIPYEGDIISEILSDNSLKSDTIHPNAQGYQQMAEAIETLLIKANAIEKR
ncbi:lysophospholipase L1-like esterase [Beggiatoa alba B18LD]|uniref:Lysophospholipase L1-like esterase n=1 Tax=Beggiatoa alba B18LD TaxID=395493 RepID=I3CH89_9GAMM|nr:arylesterase [Beggiatoa alba]EIJ42982.1 lysophospholipase L1-like esterase [Beggiatoa alba B18LD]